MSHADLLEAVVSVTAGGQFVAPPPIVTQCLVLETRVVQSGSQTIAPDAPGT